MTTERTLSKEQRDAVKESRIATVKLENCARKKKYGSIQRAENFALHLLEVFKRVQSPYQCETCKFFHLRDDKKLRKRLRNK